MSDTEKFEKLCELAAKSGRVYVATDVFRFLQAGLMFGRSLPDGVDVIHDPDLAAGTVLAVQR